MIAASASSLHSAPIGVFDSGIGGLTVARALTQALPNESLLYFGDTARVPYGDKSPEVIADYAGAVLRFLLTQGVKAVVVACNTVSAVALRPLREQTRVAGIPIFEVITPAVEAALAQSPRGEIGIIGTRATVQSHVYRHEILQRKPEARVLEKATPLLVPLVEEGLHDTRLSDSVMEAYLSDTGLSGIDTLILGCTHYPLLLPAIQRYYTRQGLAVGLIDSSAATAAHVAAALAAQGRLRPAGTPAAEHQFCVSDLTPAFAEAASQFFGTTLRLRAVQLG